MEGRLSLCCGNPRFVFDLRADGFLVFGAFEFADVSHDQTFSTSGRPRSPEGRKISTIARMEKEATSL